MARRLVLVPRSPERLRDTTRIEPGYPKPWTEAEMRTWADDLGTYYRATPEQLETWRGAPAAALTPEQQRALEVESHLFREPDRGIKGDLREDGTVELSGGRHRAGYLVERGVDPVPVWVSARDERQLDAFDTTCRREVREARPELELHRAEAPRRTLDRLDPTTGGDRERV